MISLINGSCYDELKKLENNSIDLILTDPPYGTTKNQWDSVLDWEVLWKELNRVIKPNRAIILFAQMPFSAYLVSSNYKGYKHFWTWHKKLAGNFAVAKYMPLTVTEDIYVFTSNGEKVDYFPQMVEGKSRMRGSKNAKTNGQGFGGIEQVYYESNQRYPKNLLEFPAVNRRESIHPSQKPTELLTYLTRTYSQTGDTVLDFTAGVFSSGVAAINTERNYIGIELDKNYYDLGYSRIFSDERRPLIG